MVRAQVFGALDQGGKTSALVLAHSVANPPIPSLSPHLFPQRSHTNRWGSGVGFRIGTGSTMAHFFILRVITWKANNVRHGALTGALHHHQMLLCFLLRPCHHHALLTPVGSARTRDRRTPVPLTGSSCCKQCGLKAVVRIHPRLIPSTLRPGQNSFFLLLL